MSSSSRQTSHTTASKQSRPGSKQEVSGGGMNALADGETSEQQLLPFFKMIAEVVPGPNYNNVVNMEKFLRCIDMFEERELPKSLISDRSPFKQFDVAKRINSVRKASVTAESTKSNGDVGIPPTTADAAHKRLASATSSPAASTVNAYSPAANGVASPAESQQRVPLLRIIKNKLASKAEPVDHINGGELSADIRQQHADASWIVEQSNKRRIEEEPAPPKADEPNVVAGDAVVVEPALKKRKTRPVRKRRIDLSDDDGTDDDDNDAGDNKSSATPAVPSPLSLKQQLGSMLQSLPPLFESAQRSAAAQFAVFYAEQERDAAIFRHQQAKRLEEEAARVANEAAVVRSPYLGGYGGLANSIDAVINFSADDDDEDGFSFGIGPSTSTPNKASTASTSGYLSAEAATTQRPSFPDNLKQAVSPVPEKVAMLAVADFAMPDAVHGSSSARNSGTDAALLPPELSQALSVDTLHSSSNTNTNEDSSMDVVDAENGFMQAVAAVDDDFLTRLHTQNVPGCNGYYDAEHRWHDFTDGYLTRRSDGKRIGVAPYVVLD